MNLVVLLLFVATYCYCQLLQNVQQIHAKIRMVKEQLRNPIEIKEDQGYKDTAVQATNVVDKTILSSQFSLFFIELISKEKPNKTKNSSKTSKIRSLLVNLKKMF